MTSTAFYKLVLSLWGEDWRPSLKAFLASHGYSYTRQSFWNWQRGDYPVPEEVARLLNNERTARKDKKVSQPI